MAYQTCWKIAKVIIKAIIELKFLCEAGMIVLMSSMSVNVVLWVCDSKVVQGSTEYSGIIMVVHG